MDKRFLLDLYASHARCPDCPGPEAVSNFFIELLGTLFPDFSKKVFGTPEELELHMKELKMQLGQMLFKSSPEDPLNGEQVATHFFDKLPDIHKKLSQDAVAMYEGDPAAKSLNEVIRSYPGFYAISAYRIAHALHQLKVRVIPRTITEHAHSRTGIDIHPGAEIGDFFCIDHGTGIVIGETTVIGNGVKMYQGVTLGALSISKQDAEKKRHPTVEDNVTIYAGATILGGETIVGHDSIIGGNVWITRSVPPFTKIYYKTSVQSMNIEETDVRNFRMEL